MAGGSFGKRRGSGESGDEEAINRPRSGRITKITSQVREPERVSIFLDGVFAFGLPADVATTDGLSVGEELDEARVAALLIRDEAGRATTAALAFLAYRPRSEREVRDRLRQKGYGAEAVAATVAKLEDWRYLDDADFARRWVENRVTQKPRGRRLLEQELRVKGIDVETSRQVIDDVSPDESAQALDLALAKRRAYANDAPPVARRKLGAYLARRGYGFEVIRPILDRVLGDEDAGTEPDGERGRHRSG